MTFRFYRTPTEANMGNLYEMSGPGGSVVQTLDAIVPEDLSPDMDYLLTPHFRLEQLRSKSIIKL